VKSVFWFIYYDLIVRHDFLTHFQSIREKGQFFVKMETFSVILGHFSGENTVKVSESTMYNKDYGQYLDREKTVCMVLFSSKFLEGFFRRFLANFQSLKARHFFSFFFLSFLSFFEFFRFFLSFT